MYYYLKLEIAVHTVAFHVLAKKDDADVIDLFDDSSR